MGWSARDRSQHENSICIHPPWHQRRWFRDRIRERCWHEYSLSVKSKGWISRKSCSNQGFSSSWFESCLDWWRWSQQDRVNDDVWSKHPSGSPIRTHRDPRRWWARQNSMKMIINLDKKWKIGANKGMMKLLLFKKHKNWIKFDWS